MNDDADRVAAAYKQGTLDQRLSGFDNHFAAVNGSIEKTAQELHRLFGLLEDRLDSKAERTRVHELLATLAALELRVTALDAAVVRKEGPIMDRIAANVSRLDVLEAKLPAMMLQLKEDVLAELRDVRAEITEAKFGGSLRRWAAAGTAFAFAFGVVLVVARAIGLMGG